jgi:hypothetical protein
MRNENGHNSGTTQRESQAIVGAQKGTTDHKTVAPRLLDLKAAGDYLSLSYWTMRDLVFAGVLPTVRIPCPRGDGRAIRRILVDRHDLDAFIEKNKEREP